MKTYNVSNGLVYGLLWGGGHGAYPSKKLYDYTSKTRLITKATAMLNDGSLDSGMGYQNLTGALLIIEMNETVNVKNKEYARQEYEDVFIGKLTNKEKSFLRKTFQNY